MISIIIPVYNAEKYIERCLNSILNQTYGDFEVICIDDGSKDNSFNILEEYSKKDKRIRVYKNDKNRGQAITRNTGMEYAYGEYLTFIDADDTIEPSYLESFASTIELDVDLAYTRLERVFEEGVSLFDKTFNHINFVESPLTTIKDSKYLITKILSGPVCKLIKKDFIKKNDIKFCENVIYEDVLFTVSLLVSNPKLISVDKEPYKYYVHSDSSIMNGNTRALEMFTVFDRLIEYAKSRDIFEEYKEELQYLAFYHIAIATMWRLFLSQPFKLFKHRKLCANYIKSNFGNNMNNKYVKENGFIVKAYLFIMFGIK